VQKFACNFVSLLFYADHRFCTFSENLKAPEFVGANPTSGNTDKQTKITEMSGKLTQFMNQKVQKKNVKNIPA